MNVENIDTLIDHLKYQKISEETQKNNELVGFNMDFWAVQRDRRYSESSEEFKKDHSGHNCGTVACLAGHIQLIQLGKHKFHEIVNGYGFTENEIVKNGAIYLGLPYSTAQKLFGIENANVELGEVTLDEAIAVLENLKVTGKVKWGLSAAKR